MGLEYSCPKAVNLLWTPPLDSITVSNPSVSNSSYLKGVIIVKKFNKSTLNWIISTVSDTVEWIALIYWK